MSKTVPPPQNRPEGAQQLRCQAGDGRRQLGLALPPEHIPSALVFRGRGQEGEGSL